MVALIWGFRIPFLLASRGTVLSSSLVTHQIAHVASVLTSPVLFASACDAHNHPTLTRTHWQIKSRLSGAETILWT